MAFSEKNLSQVRLGRITPYTIDNLRLLK